MMLFSTILIVQMTECIFCLELISTQTTISDSTMYILYEVNFNHTNMSDDTIYIGIMLLLKANLLIFMLKLFRKIIQQFPWGVRGCGVPG